MIFDSAAILKLVEKHDGEPDRRLPEVVFLARSPLLAGEREYIEDVISQVRETKANDWMGRLISKDETQFYGAWLEIMLYDWLKQHGPIEVEPEIEGAYPDYSVEIDGERIAVEARAVLIDPERRAEENLEAELFHVLHQIEAPYLVIVEDFIGSEAFPFAHLQDAARAWLTNDPKNVMLLQDDQGHRLILRAKRLPNRDQVTVLGMSQFRRVSGDQVKRPLKEKAGQHKPLRAKGHPYVIAVLLEAPELSAEEVAEAWIGRQQLELDTENFEVVGQSVDLSGLHFFGDEVRHKSVSGTLVLKRSYIDAEKRYGLRSWYVQNPYAEIPIDPQSFQVEARFIVVEQAQGTMKMEWVSAGAEDTTGAL